MSYPRGGVPTSCGFVFTESASTPLGVVLSNQTSFFTNASPNYKHDREIGAFFRGYKCCLHGKKMLSVQITKVTSCSLSKRRKWGLSLVYPGSHFVLHIDDYTDLGKRHQHDGSKRFSSNMQNQYPVIPSITRKEKNKQDNWGLSGPNCTRCISTPFQYCVKGKKTRPALVSYRGGNRVHIHTNLLGF